jgi:prolyl oligopeptidase
MEMKFGRFAFAFVMGLTALSLRGAAPETPKRPVTDVYHGTSVVDDYRWLEDGQNAEVKDWTRRQREEARRILDASPERAKLVARLTELFKASSTSYVGLREGGGKLFAFKKAPPAEQPLLVALKSAEDPGSEKIILDPNTLSAGGATSINLFWPSPDGKLVAVSLTSGGSEEGNLSIYETETAHALADRIPRVAFATAGAGLAWKADSSGFWYTRYPRAGERPAEDLNFFQQVYFHRVGADEKADSYIFGKDFPRIAEVILQTLPANRGLIAGYQYGDGGDFAFHVLEKNRPPKQLARLEDGVKSIAIAPDGELYLFSRSGAPRGKIMRLKSGEFDLAKATTIIAESEPVIRGYDTGGLEIAPAFFATRRDLFVIDIIGGPSQIRHFDRSGQLQRVIPSEPISSIDGLVPIAGDQILFEAGSYVRPNAWYRYDARKGKVRATKLAEKSPINYEDCEVSRQTATSKDGTKIPLTIISRRGTKLDGNNPTLLYGYGGYGIVVSPGFLGPRDRLWLDRGGVFAIANLRGGGEFGEEWHKAGNLTNKQNVFDDFIAGAEFLIQSGYTKPARLAIEGGSNGGLLMGAALTQRPELFRAVVSHVGIYDMLRVELDPNGSFNIPEFGSVKDPQQFAALNAYSPYHRVKEGVAYPAVLFMTGENDHRVNPMNSRKMTARLQAATSSGRPILLRTSDNSGHGMGTAMTEKIEQSADVLAFLIDQLAVGK